MTTGTDQPRSWVSDGTTETPSAAYGMRDVAPASSAIVAVTPGVVMGSNRSPCGMPRPATTKGTRRDGSCGLILPWR